LLFVISVIVIPCGLSLHTHTHCMSCAVYLNFLCLGKCLCWLNSQLSFISLLSFEMLPDCVISGLYMRVLKLTWEKLNYANISLVFYLSLWSIRTELFLRPNERSLKTCDSFSAIHTSLHFYWFLMAWCVFFSWISPEIFTFFAHFFSSHDLYCVFRYSIKFLCF